MRRWEQRRRSDQRDVRAQGGERLHIAARDAAVLDVADDRDAQPVEAVAAVEVGANGVAVEQGLRRVLVPAVAGVDDAGGRPAGDHLRRAARSVAHDERVDAHRGDRLDGVAQALALVDAARRDREVHRVGAEPLGGGVEARARARRVLEEQADDVLAAQRRHLRDRPLRDLDHVIGELQQAMDVGGATRSAIDNRCFMRSPRRPALTLYVFVTGGRQVLADVVGADRQLADGRGR